MFVRHSCLVLVLAFGLSAALRNPVRHRAPQREAAQLYRQRPAPAPASHHYQAASPYSYSYSVNDGYSGNDYGHSESSDGVGVVSGSYHVLLPDGRLQTVTYTADPENGYRAHVEYSGIASTALYKQPPTPHHTRPSASTPLASLTARPTSFYVDPTPSAAAYPYYETASPRGYDQSPRGYRGGQRRRRRIRKVKKNNNQNM